MNIKPNAVIELKFSIYIPDYFTYTLKVEKMVVAIC